MPVVFEVTVTDTPGRRAPVSSVTTIAISEAMPDVCAEPAAGAPRQMRRRGTCTRRTGMNPPILELELRRILPSPLRSFKIGGARRSLPRSAVETRTFVTESPHRFHDADPRHAHRPV